MTGQSLEGPKKAAALLVSVGPQVSSQLLKHLDEEALERIMLELYHIGRIDSEVRNQLMQEALEGAKASELVNTGGFEYAREVLHRTVGAQKATELLEKLADREPAPFEYLRSAEPAQIAQVLSGEHPQAAALVLAHLTATQVASILPNFDTERQSDIATRLAGMDRSQPEAIATIQRYLEKRFLASSAADTAVVGGIDRLVKILLNSDRAAERAIMERLDPALADEVKQRMFVFEDLVKLDDRSVQRILREVNSKELAIALRGATQAVKDKIFHNMSSRAGALLQEDMDSHGPVRLKVVDEAQRDIVAIVRRLSDADEIVITRGPGDEIIV